MYKLETDGFKYIPPICPRCGSHDIKAMKNVRLECRRDGYNGHWREFFVGKRREEVQKLFLQGNLTGKVSIEKKK